MPTEGSDGRCWWRTRAWWWTCERASPGTDRSGGRAWRGRPPPAEGGDGLPGVGGGFGAAGGGEDARAGVGVLRAEGPAVAPGERHGVGDRGVRDAAPGHGGPDLARGAVRPAVGPDPGDPAPRGA